MFCFGFVSFFLVFFSGIAPQERGKELEGKEGKEAKQSSHESWKHVVLLVASRVLIGEYCGSSQYLQDFCGLEERLVQISSRCDLILLLKLFLIFGGFL